MANVIRKDISDAYDDETHDYVPYVLLYLC